jgi:hypothetical protein
MSIDQKYNAQAQITIAAYSYNELGQLVKRNLQSMNSVGRGRRYRTGNK